jgi:hypothetical protein
MGRPGETYAISPAGEMLSPSRFENMLKQGGFLPDRPDASSVLNIQVRDPGGDLTRGYQPAVELEARPLTAVARMAVASRGKSAAQQTGVIMQPYRDYRGLEVLGASDIYSVGTVAYFLLTGRPVFQALTGLDLQNQVLHGEPESPSKRAGGPIPAGLQKLVLECLAKDPAKRPSNTADLLEKLEALSDVDHWTRQQARDWWVQNVPGLLRTSN